ncbi:uncharacterized protein BDV17DRAFT_1409 [Aspergillus undulatus]|uniref:uncharacterized protein n=1 Tax=Aspergillus undulatus TaxID=1810928 RepID=UPI003CCD46BA
MLCPFFLLLLSQSLSLPLSASVASHSPRPCGRSSTRRSHHVILSSHLPTIFSVRSLATTTPHHATQHGPPQAPLQFQGVQGSRPANCRRLQLLQWPLLLETPDARGPFVHWARGLQEGVACPERG